MFWAQSSFEESSNIVRFAKLHFGWHFANIFAVLNVVISLSYAIGKNKCKESWNDKFRYKDHFS